MAAQRWAVPSQLLWQLVAVRSSDRLLSRRRARLWKDDVTDRSIAQLDDIEKKVEGGKSQRGLFNRIDYSLKNFKCSA
jgi:hypothetical protein